MNFGRIYTHPAFVDNRQQHFLLVVKIRCRARTANGRHIKVTQFKEYAPRNGQLDWKIRRNEPTSRVRKHITVAQSVHRKAKDCNRSTKTHFHAAMQHITPSSTTPALRTKPSNLLTINWSTHRNSSHTLNPEPTYSTGRRNHNSPLLYWTLCQAR